MQYVCGVALLSTSEECGWVGVWMPSAGGFWIHSCWLIVSTGRGVGPLKSYSEHPLQSIQHASPPSCDWAKQLLTDKNMDSEILNWCYRWCLRGRCDIVIGNIIIVFRLFWGNATKTASWIQASGPVSSNLQHASCNLQHVIDNSQWCVRSYSRAGVKAVGRKARILKKALNI